MKKLLTLPVLIMPLLTLPLLAMAADAAKKETHRTTRLGTCSTDAHAKGLKGDERKKFIAGCIASPRPAKPAVRAPAAP